uniref:Uncharacterized protein n=1 Tax=Anguilla anguilla TaxID=7936 RepID=A0A0E9QIL9_ANGAN
MFVTMSCCSARMVAPATRARSACVHQSSRGCCVNKFAAKVGTAMVPRLPTSALPPCSSASWPINWPN